MPERRSVYYIQKLITPIGTSMEQILEIRDGCNTPGQLLRSLAFARFLKIYKQEFIVDLESRSERRRQEADNKIEFIKKVSTRDIIKILETDEYSVPDMQEKGRELMRFIDGAFHHYRGSAYSRLVRLQNDVVATKLETAQTVKDKVTSKAQSLSDLILETRRLLLNKVNMEQGVRRTPGLDASPNVTAGEISGHYFNYPADYSLLAHVPLTIAADIKTGVDYSTPSNKRAKPFYELKHNPFNLNKFNIEDWVSVPLQVGASLIITFIHKSRGCIEMEPGLLNLFPFAKIEDITHNRAPDGILFFGDPNAEEKDLGYYHDQSSNMLIGVVPNIDELKYFGYAKKPILTLCNVLAILNGDLPLHCGCTRYVVRFDNEKPYIAEMLIKADDMGKISLIKQGSDNISRPVFCGTETGAFACLDGFSEQAKLQMAGREVGYNNDTGSNARQIVPVTDVDELYRDDPLDILLYMNNFILTEPRESTIKADMNVEDALQHFRLGERVAAGSTQTHRGSKESSYWANPFPLLRDNDGTVLHPKLFETFSENEKSFINDMGVLINRKELKIGVAHSQLMAGVYEGNTDEDLLRCGFTNRDQVEQEGPVKLADDLIDLIKSSAVEKRTLSLENIDEVSITIALVGDSRTGKSETAEKMEGILGLQLV
ncbi:NAD-specific glutamate dehydrogenase, large form [hydrothermal vent metagenome]|uniref:NAD-specific glutamate dehydrogenase, large form n=1 Tax=hydrothermal vent metagenome TaxID=652676 RepID=A0A3B0XDZ1_9ZZZZ